MNTGELLTLRDKILQQETKLLNLKQELKHNCTHPEAYTHIDEKYFSGGYDYCASTLTTRTCGLCGKYLGAIEENCGGGFE